MTTIVFVLLSALALWLAVHGATTADPLGAKSNPWRDLWTAEGEIAAAPYAVYALVLASLAYNLDRLAASLSWPAPARVALAAPFVWAGGVLTVRRARAALGGRR